MKRLLVVLIILLAPLFLLGAKHGANDAQFGQITASGITLRDASGMEMITIGSDKEEGSSISIYNNAGKRAISLGIQADGKGSGIMVTDAEGSPGSAWAWTRGFPA